MEKRNSLIIKILKMNDAIKLSIKGGYNGENLPFDHNEWLLVDYIELNDNAQQILILDPLFWQALGKALGWGIYTGQPPFWKSQALRYFNLLLTGGNTEQWWKDLLTSQK